MPPQPLSRVRSNAGMSIEIDAISKRPALAPLVLEAIATWAHSDTLLADLTAKFLEADFEIVTKMLQALTSNEGRLAAIRAAAKHALSEDDNQLFEIVLKVTKPSRDKRNDFAHHLWGYSNELPNALLLVDPKHVQIMSAGFDAESRRRLLMMPPKSDIGDILETLKTHIFVYRKKDLQEAARDAKAAYAYIHNLLFVLNHNHPASEHMRTELLSQPPIQQALQRLTSENAQ